MPEVLFLHKGLHAASTRYRALQYFEGLQEAGWKARELQVSGSLSQYRSALQAASRADVVVVLKKPFTPLFRFLLRRKANWLVFDFDDAVNVYDTGQSNPRRLRQFQSMLKICDDVWAGNRALLESAEVFARRSELLQTTLAHDRYRLPATKPAASLDLVWIGGSASRPWLESVFSTLEKAATLIPRLRLKIIADFTLESEVLEVLEVPWSEAGETRELVSAHIGIAPLPDNVFTRGKCGLKTLQYMAAGLPVIASPTSVQSLMVEDGVSGRLARNEQEWLASIQQLAADASLRETMGAAGRARCAEQYSISAGCAIMLKRLSLSQQSS